MRNLIYFCFATTLSVFTLNAQTTIGSQNIQTTGMIGVADGQTAQLNLLNPGIQAPALGVICSATVSFVDASGGVVKSTTLTVIPGQSQSFSIKSDTDLSLTAGQRKEIRATITIPPIPPSTGAASTTCKVFPTLEIIDTGSGRTLVTLSHTEPIPSIFGAPQRN
jgi:hypothetical protein